MTVMKRAACGNTPLAAAVAAAAAASAVLRHGLPSGCERLYIYLSIYLSVALARCQAVSASQPALPARGGVHRGAIQQYSRSSNSNDKRIDYTINSELSSRGKVTAGIIVYELFHGHSNTLRLDGRPRRTFAHSCAGGTRTRIIGVRGWRGLEFLGRAEWCMCLGFA